MHHSLAAAAGGVASPFPAEPEDRRLVCLRSPGECNHSHPGLNGDRDKQPPPPRRDLHGRPRPTTLRRDAAQNLHEVARSWRHLDVARGGDARGDHGAAVPRRNHVRPSCAGSDPSSGASPRPRARRRRFGRHVHGSPLAVGHFAAIPHPALMPGRRRPSQPDARGWVMVAIPRTIRTAPASPIQHAPLCRDRGQQRSRRYALGRLRDAS